MGMTAYITNPPTCVSFNQTDNCEILKSINRMNTTVTNFGTARNNDISTFYNDVSKFNGRRILISNYPEFYYFILRNIEIYTVSLIFVFVLQLQLLTRGVHQFTLIL